VMETITNKRWKGAGCDVWLPWEDSNDEEIGKVKLRTVTSVCKIETAWRSSNHT
jgi:hypothetical protein